MSKQTGWLVAILTYFIYSSNSPLAKAVFNNGMSPATLLSSRFLVGALLFGATLLLTNLGTVKGDERPLNRQGYRVSLVCGILNGIALLSFFNSFIFLQASIASVLGIGCYLVFTLLILTGLGEAFTAVKGIRLLLGIGGVMLLVNPSGGAQVDPRGVFLIIIGSACFATQMILVQRYLKQHNLWQISTFQVVVPAIMMLLFWFIDGFRAGELDTFVPGMLGWITIIVLGVFSTFIGRWMTYKAVTTIGSGEMALISPLETALVILWSFLFLAERLTSMQWLGVFLVLIGVVLGQVLERTAVISRVQKT